MQKKKKIEQQSVRHIKREIVDDKFMPANHHLPVSEQDHCFYITTLITTPSAGEK